MHVYLRDETVDLEMRMVDAEGLVPEGSDLLPVAFHVRGNEQASFRALLPGFNDNHTHPISYGLGLNLIDARPATVPTLAGLQDAFRDAANTPPMSETDSPAESREQPQQDPAHQEDRVLIKLEQVPPYLVETLVAVEDREFFNHFGVSPKSIARAVWVNATAGQVRQGGSTLTQQLVKNFYLTNERTLVRKATEAMMAVLLELTEPAPVVITVVPPRIIAAGPVLALPP